MSDEAQVPDESTVAAEPDDRRAARDDLLVELLATGRSYEEAAAVAHCSGRTVARRMSDEAFRDRVTQRRGRLVAEITGQLTDIATQAVAAMRDALADEDPAVRLRAAQMALSHLSRFHHQTDLEDLSRQILARLDDATTKEAHQ